VRKMSRLLVIALSVVVIQGLLVVNPAAGLDRAAVSDSEHERHCVVLVGEEGRSVPETSSETCFRSEGEANAVVQDLVAGTSSASRSSGNTVIGIHYSARDFSGSSVTVVGTTCSGGVWYPTGFWNNNIESSRYYCGNSGTTFHNLSSCSGSSRIIYSAQTSLGNLNNRASCVQYG